MNRRLAVLAVAALAAAGAAVPAHAAKTVCLQIQDAAGDGTVLAVPQNQAALDILSGDVATGRRNLVAALRLASVTPDPALAGGVTYTLSFSAGGTTHVLAYRRFAGGEQEADITVGEGTNATTSAVGYLVDVSTNTVTWTVARKQVPALKKPGAKLSGLSAGTGFSNNVNGPVGAFRGSVGSDTAQTGRSYTDMTPTCLKGT